MKRNDSSRIAVCLVGTGAVRANPRRGGPCQIVEIGAERVMVDCGRSAVASMSRFGYAVEEISTVCITHLHFDHICDLAYFVLLSWNNGRTERLRFFGPPGLEDYLTRGIAMAYQRDIDSRLGHGKSPLGMEWTVNEISEDGQFHSGEGFELHALSSPHAGLANLNYRVDTPGGRIGITSDTSPSDDLPDFYRAVDLLVAECSGTREFLQSQPWGSWHLCPETLAGLCADAEVARVLLKHPVIEDWSDDLEISEKMAEEVRAHFSGQVSVGQDGLVLSL